MVILLDGKVVKKPVEGRKMRARWKESEPLGQGGEGGLLAGCVCHYVHVRRSHHG